MAKQSSSTNLFASIKATGRPKSDPSEEIPEEPKEFPLGEIPQEPGIIEEFPPDIPQPSETDMPPAAASRRVQEMDMLKQRAQLMGIKFSNNISLSMLRAKVQAKLDGEKDEEEDEDKEDTEQAPVQAQGKAPAKSARQAMYENEMRLVRLRITNLDPKKKDLPGEIFTVANKVLGAVKKYIPYGETTDNGYHVPYIIYRQLREREFLNIKTRKDRQGRTIVESSMAREFALEELPPLTQQELHQLAAQQAAAAGMST